MSSSRFEAFLARIYVDDDARAAFLDDPRTEAAKAGLTDTEVESLTKIDRVGLDLFAKSLERKRGRRRRIMQGKGWRFWR
jgi:hypothetical protein